MIRNTNNHKANNSHANNRNAHKKDLPSGLALLAAFAVWTLLIQCIDVQPAGPCGTSVGFAGFNLWFHRLTGVHMSIYTITDWLGLVPIAVCMGFGVLGLIQLIRRRSLCKVDTDIILLGVYYVVVILAYLIFEMIPINYRPILIDGFLEASYPSSTTLLVLSVMPTLKYQIAGRARSESLIRLINVSSSIFEALMVLGRLIAGVHWFTDIAGAVLLSRGLFLIYRGLAEKLAHKRQEHKRTGALNEWNFMKNCRN